MDCGAKKGPDRVIGPGPTVKNRIVRLHIALLWWPCTDVSVPTQNDKPKVLFGSFSFKKKNSYSKTAPRAAEVTSLA